MLINIEVNDLVEVNNIEKIKKLETAFILNYIDLFDSREIFYYCNNEKCKYFFHIIKDRTIPFEFKLIRVHKLKLSDDYTLSVLCLCCGESMLVPYNKFSKTRVFKSKYSIVI